MNEIICDTTAWPILKMHFPSHPTDEMVIAWLDKMDALLKQQKKCVVISTFAENYQFSSVARRRQALWFKHNKILLHSLCKGMVRVTEDPLMIAKLTRPAMHKGMPFACIPVPTLARAQILAAQLLAGSL